MTKRIKSRVYLNDGIGFREFLWFSEGVDASLYFCSSITKLFKKGYSGNDYVPVGGGRFDYTNGRKLTSNELKDKTSFHQSGIINHSTHQDKERKRSYSIPLIEYEDIVPVASVIPMTLEKYPITKKTIRDKDIIINLNKSNNRPMAIFFYIEKENKNDPLIVDKIKNDFKSTDLQKVILKNWQLCALSYSNCRDNITWPDLQITIKAEPNEDGKINVPVFGHI